ncbi:hypothetical protein [Algibacter luteus]|uniref:hypothetical protein n=1 Tax=Algibacter luteus TaxID=1178825 RepID=UPI0025966170|nr:hypothetical protein [Algibacter luteus]WJJ96351.1 hypothetical protein O5O44_14145 [Algibacter luteus]
MRKLFYFIFVSFLFSCTDEVTFGDLLDIRQSRDFWVSDGSDEVTFVLTFNEDAKEELIKVEAEITNGTFVDSESNKITIKPIRDIKKNLKAMVTVKSSTVNLDSEVEFNINQYIYKATITSNPSIPANLVLKTLGFSIDNNFEEAFPIDAVLTNNEDKNVSKGNNVIFKDFLSDGTSGDGKFTKVISSSDHASIAKTTYFAGQISGNQKILIKAILLDENGLETTIEDSIEILVTEAN